MTDVLGDRRHWKSFAESDKAHGQWDGAVWADRAVRALDRVELLESYLRFRVLHGGMSSGSVLCWQMGKHEDCKKNRTRPRMPTENCGCSCHYDDPLFPVAIRPPEGYVEYLHSIRDDEEDRT